MEKYSISEVAIILKVSTNTVRSYIKKGQLKATKIKRGLRFQYEISQENIDEFNEKHNIFL